MATALTGREQAGAPLGPAAPAGQIPGKPPVAYGGSDAWPRTNRVLPWMIAVFLVMLWLVPFDSLEATINAPVDLKLDRFLIMALILVWLATVFTGGKLAPKWERTPVDWALLAFVGIAVASVLLNVATLVTQDEVGLATKRLALLFSYAAFFFVVASSLRRSEVDRFIKLLLGLAVLTSVGTLYEYFGGANLFYDFADTLTPDALFELNRVNNAVVGPTRHGLALAGILAMALSYALVQLIRSPSSRGRLIYGAAAILLFGGIFATSRKTGNFAAIATVGVLLAYRPRELGRLVPVAIVAFLALLLFAPNAVNKQLEQVEPSKISADASGSARQDDYKGVVPEVRKYPVLGRGYGTYTREKYRTLDNGYLLLLLETGLVGLAGFLLLIGSVFLVTHKRNRDPDLDRAGPSLAATGSVTAFAVAMVLFDAHEFAQVPYVFLFAAGLAVVANKWDGLTPEAKAEEGAAAVVIPQAVRSRGALHDAARRRPRSPLELPARPGKPVAAQHEGRRRIAMPTSARKLLNSQNLLVGILLLGTLALFAGGGSERGDTPTLGAAGDDPFGLDQYGEVPKGKKFGVVGGGDPDAAPVVADSGGSPASGSAPSGSGGSGPTQFVLGDTRTGRGENDGGDGKGGGGGDNGGGGRGDKDGNGGDQDTPVPPRDEEEEPQQPENEEAPPPSDGGDEGGNGPESCIPVPGVDDIFIQILGQDPCQETAFDKETIAKIQQAVVAGKLSAGDVEKLEKAHRELAKKDGGSKLLGGFTFLLVGGGGLLRRRRSTRAA